MIKHICDCGNDNVDIMSVVETVSEVNGCQISGVEITYVCSSCGNTDKDHRYLYQLDKISLKV